MLIGPPRSQINHEHERADCSIFTVASFYKINTLEYVLFSNIVLFTIIPSYFRRRYDGLFRDFLNMKRIKLKSR